MIFDDLLTCSLPCVTYVCDTVVSFEIPASHMCDIVDYPYIYIYTQVDHQLSIVDYQLLFITHICIQEYVRHIT